MIAGARAVHCQLAFALLLQARLPSLRQTCAFDPVFSKLDSSLLNSYSIQVSLLQCFAKPPADQCLLYRHMLLRRRTMIQMYCWTAALFHFMTWDFAVGRFLRKMCLESIGHTVPHYSTCHIVTATCITTCSKPIGVLTSFARSQS